MGTLRQQDTYAQGRFSTVFLSLLQTGDFARPVFQTFMVGGFHGTVTIVAAVPTASYVAVIDSEAYTVVAEATDTVTTIAQKLINLINAGNVALAVNLRNVTTTAVFSLVKVVTFTLANTGTTTPADLTVSAVAGSSSGATAGASSLTISNTVIGRIAGGDYLRATQPDGQERSFKLTSNVNSGSTLAITDLYEAIEVGSLIQFPNELFGREQLGWSAPNKTASVANLNTLGFDSPVVTGGSATMNLAGDYSSFDPAIQNAKDNYRGSQNFALILQYQALRTGWSSEEEWAPVILTSKEQPLDVNGFVKCNFNAQAVIDIERTPSRPL